MLPGIAIYSLKILDGGLKLLYLMIIDGVLTPVLFLFRQHSFLKNIINNSIEFISRASESIHFRLLNKRIQLKMKKYKIHMKMMMTLYIMIIGLISLPVVLEDIISPKYMPLFSVGSSFYKKLEEKPLEISKAYIPLFKNERQAINVKNEVGVDSEKSSQEDSLGELVSLSQKGKLGSNIRKEPNTGSEILISVRGDDKLFFIDSDEENETSEWIKVRLENDMIGWIHTSLVETITIKE
jgi:hypothetical protein